MNVSLSTQKQKTSRSRIHYFISRSLTPAVLSSNGRKRRIFIASVIALNGLAIHHTTTNTARPANRRTDATLHIDASSDQGSHHLLYGITEEHLNNFLPFTTITNRLSTYIHGFNNFIYTKAQGIRGSPVPF